MIVNRKKLDAMAQCLQNADSLLRQIYRDEAIEQYKKADRKK